MYSTQKKPRTFLASRELTILLQTVTSTQTRKLYPPVGYTSLCFETHPHNQSKCTRAFSTSTTQKNAQER